MTNPLNDDTERTLQYMQDSEGTITHVVVPLALWRDITSVLESALARDRREHLIGQGREELGI